MMAIQVTQTILRDARDARSGARHPGRGRQTARTTCACSPSAPAKLETHFRQAQEDLGMIATSAEKVTRRAARIDAMDFSREEPTELPRLRVARGAE